MKENEDPKNPNPAEGLVDEYHVEMSTRFSVGFVGVCAGLACMLTGLFAPEDWEFLLFTLGLASSCWLKLDKLNRKWTVT